MLGSSERTVFASIAHIGFSLAPPPPRRKVCELKSIALMVTFLSRVKHDDPFLNLDVKLIV